MSVATTAPAVAMTTPTTSTPARQVAVTVRGATLLVPCPTWCAEPHTEGYAFLEDVSHHSAPISLATPAYSGPAEQTLIARVSQWPFSRDGATARPYMSLDAMNDTDCAELDAVQAMAFADQLVAHATRLRAMAASIAG
ncbi:DUF6907 domain-containing protein [Streptomyces nigrescens]|uniref:Uncharacterized protein n=1 Tax=Streptomyces nigrescens TaxID=1920 RepID=A0A640TCP9_STRNI|nr:hypothetical protein [Streptomyces libani]WAT94927.1 hypothetical protein STRLI_000599 [Streptomyces libani subsp. libani]GFE20076.1 hypothetical protein Sliba_05290 [Streptomyces libani subsp. libani]GGV85774.1 hypothetical protein GCM10010500_02820 [Streptomyces libani subsp. libani]